MATTVLELLLALAPELPFLARWASPLPSNFSYPCLGSQALV